MPRTKVLIVEDHALTRTGLRTALDLNQTLEVVGEASDGESGLDAALRLHPDVAVIDIGLPGIDGIELTRRIRHELPKTKVLILTMHDMDDEVIGALAAGADAYCLKAADPERIVDAVKTAAAGGAYFDPGIAHVVLRAFNRPEVAETTARSPLTARETQILGLIAGGTSNADIADRLSIGLGTVKGHIRDIMEKLSAADRTHAAVIALRRGLI
ncbi:MAG: response regulator transcription factor [Candidatus Eremiobacteraeota bacterium]|nr:response regulator transcription factor [Candidatus Eremiobacteraeota bacterium]MBV8365207.1 response regulator transcription factor [Candidatus Eremiobacteraeota bacterium]